jgi:hypothetical protein
LELYDGLSFGGSHPDLAFVKFAKRLLQISANSASCERLFSIFGSTMTKLRNRLSDNMLKSLAELKMLIRDEHRKSELTKSRLQRHFGLQDSVTTKDECVLNASTGTFIYYPIKQMQK